MESENKKIVENLADLSRINLSEAEVEKFSNSFFDVLDFINKINSFSFEDKENNKKDFSLKNITRKDEVLESSEKEKGEILKNMPKVENGYLKVKKILPN